MSEPNPSVPSAPIQDPSQQSIEIIQTPTGGPIEVKKQSTLVYPPDKGDVAIGKENLQRIYNVCKDAKAKKKHNEDWLLTIASLFAGAFVTGLVSGYQYDLSFRSILSFNISPAVATGCFVGFFLLRKNRASFEINLADRVLENIPEELIKSGDSNES